MTRLWGVPRTIGQLARGAWNLGLGMLLWRGLLLVLVLAVVVVLAVSGPIGWLAAAIIFPTLFADTIQSIITDLWNADFVRV